MKLPQFGKPSRRAWSILTIVLVGSIGAIAANAVYGSPAPTTTDTHPIETAQESTGIPMNTLPTPNSSPSQPQPFWEQDFAKLPAGALDKAVWYYELNPEVPGYNDERQGYTERTENVRIEPGTGLVIEARKEAYRYPGDPQDRQFSYTSARVDTRKSFSFEYGRLEAHIKLPKGAGSWPAFWLLSSNQKHTSKLNPTDADWAKPRFYAKDGELDIMEHYGHLPGIIEGTAHTYLETREGSTQVPDYAEVFHTYGIEVRPTKVVWTVDGRVYHTFDKPADSTDMWPIGGGNTYYPILNVAMGGTGGGQIDDRMRPWRMEVQWLRYYQ